jgi:hypothetical protein
MAQPLYYKYNYASILHPLAPDPKALDLGLGRVRLQSFTNAPKEVTVVRGVSERLRSALWALLDLGLLLFFLLSLLSPAFLVVLIAAMVYELFNGGVGPDTAFSWVVVSFFHIFIISFLSKYTPEGFPGLDLAMAVFLTVVGGALALFALATPWWALELKKAAEAAGGPSPLPFGLLLAAIATVGSFVAGKGAWEFHSRYKAHYRQLRAVLRDLKGLPPDLAEGFLGGVRRGQVAFLYNENERVTHVLVGQALFPVHPGRRRYSPGNIREAPDEELVEFLQKRTSLNALPPERILALLRGKGSAKDLEEAQRAWAMERLSEF